MNYLFKALNYLRIACKNPRTAFIPTELSTENYNKVSIDSTPYTLFYAPYAELQLPHKQ